MEPPSGFRQPRWETHVNGRIQERILSRATQFGARAAVLEALYVQITLHECRHGLSPDQPGPHPGRVRAHQHPPESFYDSSWSELDQVLLSQVFDTRFRVLQSCLHHLRGGFRQAARCALEARHHRTSGVEFFCLLPFMLLRRPIGQGRVEKSEFCRRFDMFNEEKGLVEEGVSEMARGVTHINPQNYPIWKKRTHAAQQKIQQGDVSRARHCLARAALAPGTEATLMEMQNKRPQVVSRELSEEVRAFVPDSPVALDRQTLLRSLKTAPRGSSPGQGGCTYEHIKTRLNGMRVEGYRWDAMLLSDTWRPDKSEIWETHHKHLFVGAGKYDNKHGVGIMLNKKWRQRILDTEYINERAITATIVANRQRIKLMSVYSSRSGYADHHVEKKYQTIEKHTTNCTKYIPIV